MTEALTALLRQLATDGALQLQVLASGFALAGAFLLRKPSRWAPWGFVTWLVSNPTAMAFMAMQGHWFFFFQHLVFLLFAAESVWNWLLKPRLDDLLAHPPHRTCSCRTCRKYFSEP